MKRLLHLELTDSDASDESLPLLAGKAHDVVGLSGVPDEDLVAYGYFDTGPGLAGGTPTEWIVEQGSSYVYV